MRLFLSALALLAACSLPGQINVGSTDSRSSVLKPEHLERLQNTVTIFFYREGDAAQLEQLKSALDAAWSYTELKFMRYDEQDIKEYLENYSFFSIGGSYVEQVGSVSMTSIVLYLSLWMMIDGKRVTFCQIALSPNTATLHGLRPEEYMYLYQEAVFHNWHVAFLKNALQVVNQKLEAAETLYMRDSRAYGDLAPLQNATLYIPEYVLIKYNPSTGDDTQRHSAEDLLKKYPYPYKVVTTEELDQLVLNSDSPVYYLCHIKSSARKYICILNGQSGELLYSDYMGSSYNMDSGDFGEVAAEIKAANQKK